MSAPLEVLHCDNHLLVVVKQAGIPSAPDESGDPSLLDLAREWVRIEFAKPGAAWLGLVHRLDRPVSGVMCFARTSKAAARLSAAFRERRVAKLYLGVVLGTPAGAEGVVEQWLAKDERAKRVRVLQAHAPGAQQALSRYRVLGTRGGRTLLELEPLTGRPHQLRAACSALQTPLLGDLKYGAPEPLPDASIALHALELRLRHPTRAEELRFRAPPPQRPWWDWDAPRPAPA